MNAARSGVLVTGIVSVLAIVFATNWWYSDERAVRRQLAAIAGALTIGPQEGQLATVTRAAALRKALAPDVRITAGGQEIASRDSVVGLVSRWIPPPGGVTVEFEDVQVTVDPNRTAAEVYCTAKVTGQSAAGEPTIDARELTVGFARQDGAWLVTSVRTEQTLAR